MNGIQIHRQTPIINQKTNFNTTNPNTTKPTYQNTLNTNPTTAKIKHLSKSPKDQPYIETTNADEQQSAQYQIQLEATPI